MPNQLLHADFLQDDCLTAPLPEQWQLLPQQALGKRRWFWLGLTLLPLLVELFLLKLSHGAWAVYALGAGLLLVAGMLQIWLPVHLHNTRYLLRSQDFLLESGVWWRRAVLIPLTRVQHVTVSQGPLQKRFGLATLCIFTAGGEHAEATLADIDYDLAQTLSLQLSYLIPKEERTDAA